MMTSIQRAITRFPLLFLMVLALVPRLYNLTSPVIGVHSWRQADTAAIARNFFEAPFGPSQLWRFAYPQVDWGGGGYAETEFPLYPALVSLLYRILGPHEIYARGLSVIFSLIGLYFLYKLVALCFDQSVAFWSALFYAILPLSVFYGRTVQPESLVMMCGLGGLYFFKRSLAQRSRSQRWIDLGVSGGFVAIAALLKVLPIVYLGLPLLYLAAVKYRYKLFVRWELWLYALSILGVTAAWYIHAHNIFLETGLTFGFWSGDTDRYSWASLLSVKYWLDILFRTMVRHFAVVSFFVALVGLSFRRGKAEDWMWEVGLFGSFLAGALAPTSSYVHEYYQLPVMMFGVVFIGKVCARVFGAPLQKRWYRPALTTALVLTLLTGSAIYTIDYMWRENPANSKVYALAEQVKQHTPAGSKILATTADDPTLLYLAHRHGWMISPEEVSAERLETALGDGTDFLVGSYEIVQNYADFTDESQKETIRKLLAQQYPPIVNNDRFFIAPLAP
jgi:hypothetical protein